MPKKYTGFINVKTPLNATDLQNQLMHKIGNEKSMRAIHQLLGEFCEPYVPKNTGGLREAMKAYPSCVKWESIYAHYMYTGVVYGPNIPIAAPNTWRSIPGKKKHKVKPERKLGVPGSWNGFEFGWTEPGTGDHWFDKAMAGRGKNLFSIAVTKKLQQIDKHKGGR